MRLHHLALGAHDVEGLAAFYRDLLGLPEISRHFTPEGRLRSVWLGVGEAVLMIERVEGLEPGTSRLDSGLFLLALAAPPAGRAHLESVLAAAGVKIEARTEHTSYFRDPEGNRVAFSDYPLPALDDKGTHG